VPTGFDARDVGAVDAGAARELGLRQTRGDAQGADACAERDAIERDGVERGLEWREHRPGGGPCAARGAHHDRRAVRELDGRALGVIRERDVEDIAAIVAGAEWATQQGRAAIAEDREEIVAARGEREVLEAACAARVCAAGEACGDACDVARLAREQAARQLLEQRGDACEGAGCPEGDDGHRA